MPDMLVNLYTMPKIDLEARMLKEGIVIKRAMALDKEKIVEYVKANFSDICIEWAYESEKAIFNNPPTCYIAVKDKEILGFACYDSSALGFFGPTGVSPSAQGKGIGKALLGKCLESMKELGYGYAIIGYVTDAVAFYEKAVNAIVIEDSPPGKNVYYNLIDVE